MRIAICLSGHMRTFQSTYFNLYKHFLSKSDHDVFIHTWDYLATGISKANSDISIANIQTKDKLNIIEKLYKPKNIIIEQSNNFDSFTRAGLKYKVKDPTHIFQNQGRHLSMFYSVFKANELKRQYEINNNFKYDLVFKSRGDIDLTESFPFEMLNSNAINVPINGAFTGLNDQIAIGSSDLMNYYSDLYGRIDSYVIKEKCIFRPEVLLAHHLIGKNMPVNQMDFKYNILRADGQITTHEKRNEQIWKKVEKV